MNEIENGMNETENKSNVRNRRVKIAFEAHIFGKVDCLSLHHVI